MPELPEVETVRRHLAPHVEGRVLDRLDVLDARWCEPLRPQDVAAALTARRLEHLGRRGKYLVWELSGGAYLHLHLRMTGTLLLDPRAAPHARVRFGFGDREVVFCDPRRFGTGELALGRDAHEAFFAARLGLEPLDPGFTGEHLRGLARRCRAPVKAFLLDQKKVAGVGNIYADEALFRARIHPLRPANALTARQCAALRDAVVAALEAGIAAKGATIDDFRHPDGVYGSFQDEFLVHRRGGEPCPACGGAVTKLRAAGRGTYVCRRCQPVPRARRASAAARVRRPSPGAAARARPPRPRA